MIYTKCHCGNAIDQSSYHRWCTQCLATMEQIHLGTHPDPREGMRSLFQKQFGTVPIAISNGWVPMITRVLASCWISGADQDGQPKTVLDHVKVVQVKEKFGGLRFYCDIDKDANDAAHFRGMVHAMEALSFTICEECGARGHRRGGSWIRTLCDEHEAARVEEEKKRNRK